MTTHRNPRKKINRLSLQETKEKLDELITSGQVRKNQSGFYTPLSEHAGHLLAHARSLGSDLEAHIEKAKPKKPEPEEIMGRLNRQVEGARPAPAPRQVQRGRGHKPTTHHK